MPQDSPTALGSHPPLPSRPTRQPETSRERRTATRQSDADLASPARVAQEPLTTYPSTPRANSTRSTNPYQQQSQQRTATPDPQDYYASSSAPSPAQRPPPVPPYVPQTQRTVYDDRDGAERRFVLAGRERR
jgi:hypothetical protein